MARRRNITVDNVDCSSNTKDADDWETKELVVTSNDNATKTSNGHRSWDFVDYHLLPKFLHDNEFLISYHRPELSSAVECIKSVFMLHTETWNIWTHFIGAIGSLVLCIYFLLFIAQDWQHCLAFAVFFVGAVFCMGVSATYHAFICHSEAICKLLAKLDYVGVIVLIVTSYIPWLHFAFYCNTSVKLGYIFILLLLGALCISVVVKDEFREPSYRWIRFGLFCCLGLAGLIPGIHSVLFHDLLEVVSFPIWLICMAVLYIIGGLAYAVRVPERLWPGKFDIWLQSHQIMHVCVVGGVLTCYLGAAKLAVERLGLASDCLALSVYM
jgi:adiponectin receptor